MIWRKTCKIIIRIFPFLLIAAIVFAVIWYPKSDDDSEQKDNRQIIRVWNVDTFEGGKGSRTSFLRSVATSLQKSNQNNYYLIVNYTLEGAKNAYLNGEKPDILSFGIGLNEYAEDCLPLPYSFPGGAIGNQTLAYPWCRGEYFLFSLENNFESEGKTVISDGGENLVQIISELTKNEGDLLESTAAYTAFLNRKYHYLLGTQRDVCRFGTRGVEVYKKPLPDYNDLYQYISILSEEKFPACVTFLNALQSEEIQKKLADIGMMPVSGDMSKQTVNVFTSSEILEKLRDFSSKDNDVKNLNKFLKTI